jgi:hypothetical protein
MVKTKAKTKPAYRVEYNAAPIVGKTIERVTFPHEYSHILTLHFTDRSTMTIRITMNHPEEAAKLGYEPELQWDVYSVRRKTAYPVFLHVPIADAEPAAPVTKRRK